jgi:hypothetical protein
MTVELASLQEGDSFTGALVRLEDLNLYNRCYSYRLMAAEPGPPNVVQEFILEPTIMVEWELNRALASTRDRNIGTAWFRSLLIAREIKKEEDDDMIYVRNTNHLFLVRDSACKCFLNFLSFLLHN